LERVPSRERSRTSKLGPPSQEAVGEGEGVGDGTERAEEGPLAVEGLGRGPSERVLGE
jgi:hypothetical protein